VNTLEIAMAASEQLVEPALRSRLDECYATLGETRDESLYSAIERLVQAGAQVGYTVSDLIRFLHGGMTLESFLDLIEAKMSAACIEDQRQAA